MLTKLAVLALSAQQVSAFPSLLSEAFLNKRNPDPALAGSPCPHMAAELAKRQAPGVTPPFNAAEQYVSNMGANEFVAPGPTDQRGPCEYNVVRFYQLIKLMYIRPGSQRYGQPWISTPQWCRHHQRFHHWDTNSLRHGPRPRQLPCSLRGNLRRRPHLLLNWRTCGRSLQPWRLAGHATRSFRIPQQIRGRRLSNSWRLVRIVSLQHHKKFKLCADQTPAATTT